MKVTSLILMTFVKFEKKLCTHFSLILMTFIIVIFLFALCLVYTKCWKDLSRVCGVNCCVHELCRWRGCVKHGKLMVDGGDSCNWTHQTSIVCYSKLTNLRDRVATCPCSNATRTATINLCGCSHTYKPKTRNHGIIVPQIQGMLSYAFFCFASLAPRWRRRLSCEPATLDLSHFVATHNTHYVSAP
jgi:hypothetical protein